MTVGGANTGRSDQVELMAIGGANTELSGPVGPIARGGADTEQQSGQVEPTAGCGADTELSGQMESIARGGADLFLFLFLLRIISSSKGCSPKRHPFTRVSFLCQIQKLR